MGPLGRTARATLLKSALKPVQRTVVHGSTSPSMTAEYTSPRATAHQNHAGIGLRLRLCGIDSLNEVARAVPSVASSLIISADDVAAAVAGLVANQRLHKQTRAVHGAAFWSPGHGLVALREDVGRHNALDKLAGALLSQDCKTADGLLVVTSRISVEMVQKAACIGAPILVAVSAPTALAVRVAEDAGITLITGARGNDFEIFTPRKSGLPDPDA
jgi:FdhD protein